MASFGDEYAAIYSTFGYPLTPGASLSPKVLEEAEGRLGVRLPAALRDYYLVAGRERRFNSCFNRLLPPREWTIDQKRLIFLEENQSVNWWGVSIRNPDSDDPPVSQGLNDDEITWVPEHRKCSKFLAFMLHYQAVNDGFRYTGSCRPPREMSYRFEKNGWTSYGEVRSTTAYSRPNQVVCLSPELVLAGGKTKRHLDEIASELGVRFG